MRKGIVYVVFITISLILTGCKGTNDLLKKAREEILNLDDESINIEYVDMILKDDTALVWFVSGNGDQKHDNFPLEFKVVIEETYKVIKTYKPLERGNDIVVLYWNNGLCFLVNHLQCKSIKITEQHKDIDIINEKEIYPLVHYQETLSSNFNYKFLDIDGNEIR